MKFQIVGCILFLLSLTSCESAQQAGRSISYEDQLIKQLTEGGPYEKMDAARELERLRSEKAVPYLLTEVRDKYPKIIYEPAENPRYSHEKKAYVIRDGKKVPYIDYHAPLFSALAHIAVPYFGNNQTWFGAIDEWIKQNLPKQK